MKQTTRRDYEERILRVLVYVQQHLDEPLEMERLAEVACFSPHHFHRVFSGMVGESLKEHIRRLRLERAAFLLKFSDEPVIQIALDAGYEAQESFTRRFSRLFGVAPAAFRKSQQAMPYPNSPSGVHYDKNGDVRFESVRGENVMKATIKELGPYDVVFVRHTGRYDQVGESWAKLFSWAMPKGLVMGPPVTIGMSHDDPTITPPDKLRYDACLVVNKPVEAEGEIGVQRIEAGEYAVAQHVGPYEKLGDTYSALCGQWLPDSGRDVRAAPALEFYRNNPQSTPPEQLLTDVCIPVSS
jgi:AraC family transcriptional regulator